VTEAKKKHVMRVA